MDVKDWKAAMDRANEFTLQEKRNTPVPVRIAKFIRFRERLRQMELPLTMHSDQHGHDVWLRLWEKQNERAPRV